MKRKVVKAFFDCNPHAQWCVIDGFKAYPIWEHATAVHIAATSLHMSRYYGTTNWVSVSALTSSEVGA